MALYREDIVDIELESGSLHRSWMNHAIGLGDVKANRFGVRLFRNGEDVNIGSGTCQGFFMRSDGTNLQIQGSTYTGVDGNLAWVQLPQDAYAYQGQFCLAIKLIGEGITGTMRIIDGMVDNTGTTGAVSPTSTVPTSQEIIAAYNNAVAVIDNSVRHDIDQSLTAAQKTRARTNIEAASQEDLEAEAAIREEKDTSLRSATDVNLNDIREGTINLWKHHDVSFTGYQDYDCVLPVGTYTVTVTGITTTASQSKARFELYDANGNRLSTVQENISTPESVNFYTMALTGRQNMPSGSGSYAVFTNSTAVAKIRLYSADTASNSNGKTATWSGLQIQVGNLTSVEYIKPYTAKDDVARADIDSLEKFDTNITNDFNDISEGTINLWKHHNVSFEYYEDFDCVLPAGTYTLTVTGITTEATQTTARVEFLDGSGNRISTVQENITHPESVNYYAMALTGRQNMPTGGGSFAVFTNTTQIAKVRLYSSNTAGNSIGKTATWTGLQIESGYKTSVTFMNPFTAKDDVARKALELFSLVGKKVVCFGDSIIGNYTAPTDIPTLIAKATGAECINVGFGGTRLTDNSEYGSRGYFSFCKLVEAVVSGSFTAQETALASLEDPDGLYRANLTKLEGIDFSTVDIVTFEQCTNDYYGDVYVTREGVSGNLIFDNAMRYCLDTLLTAYPNLRIVVIGPIYRWFSSSSDSNNYTNSRGFTLIDFKNKMEQIAQEYNLPFIDDYYLGINKYTHAKFLSDGTHPTEDGRELIAAHIANEIF